ncbi:MAG: cytochrome b/b6 domain-containing protein [Candidatus Sumerlaeota bacterium]|nr:cytochrome b/b6 domain-containing protein [Candidatus Sumerlaeota bacterium]
MSASEAKSAAPAAQEFIERFSVQARVQHVFMFVSVIVLMLTGIPLWCVGRPEYIWWKQEFNDYIEMMRLFHRWGAVVLIGVSVYHTLYTLFSREGRREFIQLLPYPKDFMDVTQNSLYFLGLSKERPKFRRYTYFEKFDYWAVYWGCVIMIGTGLVLWFDKWAAQYVAWLPYKLAADIHADEAILCALALLIWHFYNVHFKPSRFPGTMLWWHGKMSRHEMEEEHPLEMEDKERRQETE